MPIGRILVPTDFSEAAERAFAQAMALARSGDAEILVLHSLPPLIPLVSPMGEAGVAGLVEMGRLLDDYTRQIQGDATRNLEGLKEKGSMVIVPASALETMNLGAQLGLASLARAEDNSKDVAGAVPSRS